MEFPRRIVRGDMSNYDVIVEGLRRVETADLWKQGWDSKRRCFGHWLVKILHEENTARDLFHLPWHSWCVLVQHFHPKTYYYNPDLVHMSKIFNDLQSVETPPKWKDLSSRIKKELKSGVSDRCTDWKVKSFYKCARRIHKILVKHGAYRDVNGATDWERKPSKVMNRAKSDLIKLHEGGFDVS